MKLSERFGIVYALKPGDHQAGVDGDSIKMDKASKVTFILQMAALTANAVLKVYSGATDGTKTTAETFNHRLADAVQGSAGADNFGAWSTSAGLTLTAATYANKTLVVDIDAIDLTSGQPFVTLNIGTEASAFNAACLAILDGMRYKAHDMPSAIPAS